MPQKAIGTKLEIGSTAIGSLTNIGGPEPTADILDVTTLDSEDGYKEFIGGLIDGGEVSVDGYLKDKGTDEATLVGYIGTEKECSITFPKGAEWSFDAIVTSFSTTAEKEDLVSFSMSLKVTGKPTFTAGTGL